MKMQKFNYDEKCFTIKRNRIAKFYKIHNFIKKYSAKEITSKISKVNNSFEKILEIGSHAGELKDELLKKKTLFTHYHY